MRERVLRANPEYEPNETSTDERLEYPLDLIEQVSEQVH
jgi:hypothetical protein